MRQNNRLISIINKKRKSTLMKTLSMNLIFAKRFIIIKNSHKIIINNHKVANLLKLLKENHEKSMGILLCSFKPQNHSFLLGLIVTYLYYFIDLFFIFAYICFTLASIYLVKIVNSSLENITFKIFNFCFCLLQNLSYLFVAFSNPGIQLPE